MDAAAVQLRTNCITLQYLPKHLFQMGGWVDNAIPRQVAEAEVVPLRTLEKMAIHQALAATHHDVARTAELLGIGRTTVYRRLRDLGLETLRT